MTAVASGSVAARPYPVKRGPAPCEIPAVQANRSVRCPWSDNFTSLEWICCERSMFGLHDWNMIDRMRSAGLSRLTKHRWTKPNPTPTRKCRAHELVRGERDYSGASTGRTRSAAAT